MVEPYFTPSPSHSPSPIATLLELNDLRIPEFAFDNDSLIEETSARISLNEQPMISSPVAGSSKNYLTSHPSSSKSALDVFEKSASETPSEADDDEEDETTVLDLPSKNAPYTPRSPEEADDIYEDEIEETESLDESDTTESEDEEEEEDNGEFELADDDDEEEDENFVGYFPSNIPHLLEEPMNDVYTPIWKNFKSIIEESAAKGSNSSTENDTDSKAYDMSELQLNIETLFKANLFKQLSVIDELSKLLTGNCAIIGAETKIPDIGESIKEELPAVYNKISEHLIPCSQKDQNNLFLIELWWTWLEDLMPECSPEFIKKFKTLTVEKLRVKSIIDTFENLTVQSTERTTELRQLGTKIYDLQTLEDDELPSDYEPDNGPVYYRKQTVGNGEINESESEETPLQQSRKRKNTISESPTPAKRLRADSNSKDSEASHLPQTLTLSRRISTLSYRSSMSPPILSPNFGSKINSSIPQTPIKETSSLFSSPSAFMRAEERRQIEEGNPKRNRMKFKNASICFKYPHTGEKEIPNEDEDEEDPAVWQGDGCDSDSILSGLKMKIPLIHSNSGERLSTLKKKLESISQRRGTASDDESDTTEPIIRKKVVEKLRPPKIQYTDKRISPERPTTSEDEEEQGISGDDLEEYGEFESEENTSEEETFDHDQIFIHNGMEFTGPILKKLIKAVRQTQQQSKIMFDNVAFEAERRQCLKQIIQVETTLCDNLEGPVSETNPETLAESFKQLSMIYDSQGIILDKLEDFDIEHIAIRALNLSESVKRYKKLELENIPK
uniref:Uncharacterized protein n=1 Tax=Panagrolaimus sp. PS1159 TaxID=55785 RepID=A0AC35G4S4_9BILA